METLLTDKNTNETNNILLKKGLIIAGPCSAESEQQLLHTASGLAHLGIGKLWILLKFNPYDLITSRALLKLPGSFFI